MIDRALISVTDKTGIDELGKNLSELGFELVASGGTADFLKSAGCSVVTVESITRFPSILSGRVKTLHPLIFGGILADRFNADHIHDLSNFGIESFDVVVCNFYDFASILQKELADPDKDIEKIDIGGPSMLRAAAKNHKNTIPLYDLKDYDRLIEQIKEFGSVRNIPTYLRLEWSAKAFAYSARYDGMIAGYFEKVIHPDLPMPEKIFLALEQTDPMRYGENPIQHAALYKPQGISGDSWQFYQGKQLSYNNYIDIQAAKEIVTSTENTASVIIKHTNPCGFGIGKTGLEAYQKAVQTDPVSYFGGIVGFNKTVSEETAAELNKSFLECIIAPDYTENALEILKKKKNLRVLTYHSTETVPYYEIRTLDVGYLIQEKDLEKDDESNWKIVTNSLPDENDWEAIRLSWNMVRFAKSNAIVLANRQQLVGVGAGQMSRIDSVKIALRKAGEAGLSVEGTILASDAYFPFRDGVDMISSLGIRGIIQPGGSIRDEEVIEACNEHGLFMIFTGKRHFRH